jgi:hypothetical protein
VIKILCSAEVINSNSRNVLLDLYTSSPVWIRTLGLEELCYRQQTSDTPATTASVATMPLLTWNSDSTFLSGASQEVLMHLWQTLGFSTRADATEEEAMDPAAVLPDGKTIWTLNKAVALLSTYLGWYKQRGLLLGAWKKHRPFMPRSLRLAERHEHRVRTRTRDGMRAHKSVTHPSAIRQLTSPRPPTARSAWGG